MSNITNSGFCPHFGICGGCSCQDITYETHIEEKLSRVLGLVSKVAKDWGSGDFQCEGILASPDVYEYRNKMEFSFGDEFKDGPLALGLHKKGSFYDIISTPSCKIIDESFRVILRTTLDFVSEKGFSFYHKKRHTGYLRHLLVRKGKNTGEILIAIVTSSSEDNDLSELASLLTSAINDNDNFGTIVGILHIQNDSRADVVKNEGITVLYGRDYFYDSLLGLRFRISPFSFFQTNTRGAEVLYGVVRDYVMDLQAHISSDKPCLLDLYSGTGTIAQILSPIARHVLGVEVVAEAVQAAQINAAINELDNCSFIAGDVLKVLNDMAAGILPNTVSAAIIPDIIVLDPPRGGINPKALKQIAAYSAGGIVYVSCNPDSLARDLPFLLTHGYELKKIRCVDMFPWTGNVETVTLLAKKVI